MSENKKCIKQIGPHSFLFYINPKIYYYLSFEIVEIVKIQIFLIKIMEKETYVFSANFPFSKLGTGEASPQDAIKNISFIIHNFDFIIKEEGFNKIILSINSRSKATIELFLYNRENDAKKGTSNKILINNMKNKIDNLLITIVKQEQKISELKRKEGNQKIVLNKIGQIVNTITKKIDNKSYNNLGFSINTNQNNTNKKNK